MYAFGAAAFTGLITTCGVPPNPLANVTVASTPVPPPDGLPSPLYSRGVGRDCGPESGRVTFPFAPLSVAGFGNHPISRMIMLPPGASQSTGTGPSAQ